jgi:uncharacterized protein (TIGR02453 family)
MGFHGIPAEAFDFYDGLAVDNSRSFWADHKRDYESFVHEPLLQLGAQLEPEFGPAHLYRAYRDVRFSRDKTPIKDHQGMFVESRNGLGWYLQLGQSGLMVAGGWYTSTPDQVARYRAAVAENEGEALGGLIDAARAGGLAVGGQRLKTRPRGIDPDHPRLELLRHRSLVLSRQWEPARWMGGPDEPDRVVRESWRAMTPVIDWLAHAVGPGDPPGPSRRR